MAKEVGDGVYFQKKSKILNSQVIRKIRERGIIRNLLWRFNKQTLFV